MAIVGDNEANFFHRHLVNWVDTEVDVDSTRIVEERPRFIHAILLLAGAERIRPNEGILKATCVKQLDPDVPLTRNGSVDGREAMLSSAGEETLPNYEDSIDSSRTNTMEESVDREVRDTLLASSVKLDNGPNTGSHTDNLLVDQAIAILIATRGMLDEKLNSSRQHYLPRQEPLQHGTRHRYFAPHSAPHPPSVLIPPYGVKPSLKSSAYHPESASILDSYRFPSQSHQRGRTDKHGRGGIK